VIAAALAGAVVKVIVSAPVVKAAVNAVVAVPPIFTVASVLVYAPSAFVSERLLVRVKTVVLPSPVNESVVAVSPSMTPFLTTKVAAFPLMLPACALPLWAVAAPMVS
jgi:hypothetical protein